MEAVKPSSCHVAIGASMRSGYLMCLDPEQVPLVRRAVPPDVQRNIGASAYPYEYILPYSRRKESGTETKVRQLGGSGHNGRRPDVERFHPEQVTVHLSSLGRIGLKAPGKGPYVEVEMSRFLCGGRAQAPVKRTAGPIGVQIPEGF
jgi:hypothetical protein